MSLWSSDTDLKVSGAGEDPDFPVESVDVAVNIGTGEIRLALHNDESWRQVVMNQDAIEQLINSLQYQLEYSRRINR